MFAYLMAQLSAVMTSAEGISTKGVLKKFQAYEHVYYKNLTLFIFSIVMGIVFWKIDFNGFLFLLYSVLIVFLNENFRSKAMQNLELNTFAILTSSSIFIIYGIESLIGRETIDIKNILCILLFVIGFYLFLDVKVKDFFTLNRYALFNIIGIVIIASIDRPLAKTAFDKEWIGPETSIMLRSLILIYLFYWFGKRSGMTFKGNMKKGTLSHIKIGFLKYGREMLYYYALVYGSVMMLTLVLNTGLFLTFIFSGFYFRESKWTWKKGSAIIIATLSIILFLIK